MKRHKTLLDKPVLYKDIPLKDTYVFDIETSPNWGTYYSEWKIGNIIWMEQESFIMSFAITELLSGKVHYYDLTQYKNWKKVFCKHCDKPNFKDVDEDLIKDLHEWLSKAHVLIGHNIDRFDLRKVVGRFIKYGLEPLQKYQTIDTYKKHKQIADTSGNGLNHVTKYYGLGKKYETMKDIAKRCLQGDIVAWKEFKKYNIQDVVINEKLYLKERGWYKTAPNFNVIYGKIINCPRCLSEHLIKKGFDFGQGNVKQAYKCQNCGRRITGEVVSSNKPLK